MKNRTMFVFVVSAVMAVAGGVSAKNWRDGLKVGQCTASVSTTGNTCEVSFRGDNCSLPPITGTAAGNGVCHTPEGRFTTGDDPAKLEAEKKPAEKK